VDSKVGMRSGSTWMSAIEKSSWRVSEREAKEEREGDSTGESNGLDFVWQAMRFVCGNVVANAQLFLNQCNRQTSNLRLPQQSRTPLWLFRTAIDIHSESANALILTIYCRGKSTRFNSQIYSYFHILPHIYLLATPIYT
jgi:hypothetical protein